MAAPESVRVLVERFERNRSAYRSGQYKETQLRREFIDPLFEALGWDLANRQGFAEPYKDVVHEDAIKIGQSSEAPDYCFRIGGTRKFFVEAKKPSINVKDDTHPAYQLRRYAWSAKLPLSILTDFEELAVYDCRVRPSPSDKAAVARILLLGFEQYDERWEEIASVFSREAVLKGSFDRYAESGRRRGTAEVDAAFLRDIESWRDVLARNIALRNPRLSQRELNLAVQSTIDRIIFLRICEDRSIEDYGRLRALLSGTNVYERLLDLFRHADDRYNSGLFHFKKEKGRAEPPDELTARLVIDDKVLKEILGGLYYPESPYEFSVLPADILGQVYEQFLGKVIRLTAGHQAKVEDKPEVKKAGGVFYTPTYIVDYIVKNTVGKLLEGKTPKQVSKLRVLDPACGSGSFLIGAYQHLLDWHRDRYVENGPAKHPRELYGAPGGDWRLTTAERKRILLNNIYGVDIDPQAVEVTKLSLLLKVLEGETGETLRRQHSFILDRALPDLASNIKCGNSLVGREFVAQRRLLPLTDEDHVRINMFDWQDEFPSVFAGKDGGFDAIIGNPPYIRIQALKEWAPIEVEFYKERYRSAAKGNYDIYVVFVERGLSLLNRKGLLGFILPHKFFNAKYGEGLRGELTAGTYLVEIVNFGDLQVFSKATTYTCLLFLSRSGSASVSVTTVRDVDEWRRGDAPDRSNIDSASLKAHPWCFVSERAAPLLDRCYQAACPLESVSERIFQGLKTGADAVFIVEEQERRREEIRVYSSALNSDVWLEADLLHSLVKGGDSRRYNLARTAKRILFPYECRPSAKGSPLIPENVIGKKYPRTWRYLVESRDLLDAREGGAMRGPSWYGYSRAQALDAICLPKIFTPDIAAKAAFSLDETGELFFTGGVSGGYGILVKPEFPREVILALLNSRLLEWIVRQTSTRMRGGYFSYEARFIRSLPIRLEGTRGRDDASLGDIDSRSKEMLALNKRLAKLSDAQETAAVRRRLSALDREIDHLVYELYGLTDKEIRIVEESVP